MECRRIPIGARLRRWNSSEGQQRRWFPLEASGKGGTPLEANDKGETRNGRTGNWTVGLEVCDRTAGQDVGSRSSGIGGLPRLRNWGLPWLRNWGLPQLRPWGLPQLRNRCWPGRRLRVWLGVSRTYQLEGWLSLGKGGQLGTRLGTRKLRLGVGRGG